MLDKEVYKHSRSLAFAFISFAVAQLLLDFLEVCDAFHPLYQALNVMTVGQYIAENSDATVHDLANEFHSANSPLGVIEKTISPLQLSGNEKY